MIKDIRKSRKGLTNRLIFSKYELEAVEGGDLSSMCTEHRTEAPKLQGRPNGPAHRPRTCKRVYGHSAESPGTTHAGHELVKAAGFND